MRRAGKELSFHVSVDRFNLNLTSAFPVAETVVPIFTTLR